MSFMLDRDPIRDYSGSLRPAAFHTCLVGYQKYGGVCTGGEYRQDCAIFSSLSLCQL